MRLENKRALVTGAASGFGREIAHRFGAEGARVAVVDINESGARTVAADMGKAAIALGCDVASGEAVRGAVDRTIEAFGGLDIVVNNAGWSHPNRPVLEIDEAAFRKLYEVNVLSIFHMTHAVLPHWREIGGGVMINVGSTAAIRPRPGLTWYNSSKGAVHLMTKSLALELAPDNVRVCALAPVISATGLLETFMGEPDTPETRARFTATIPMGRFCEPADMANAALFLASDEARFLTGNIMEVDGGRTV